MSQERAGHTLQATALIHEVFIKLIGPQPGPWNGRAHFYFAASRAMRQLLIDHARAKGRVKRGGGERPRTISNVAELAVEADDREILALDGVLERLEKDDPDVAAVVRLRFYAGLTVEQTAEALGVSPRQVDRLWAYARAVMYRAVQAIAE